MKYSRPALEIASSVAEPCSGYRRRHSRGAWKWIRATTRPRRCQTLFVNQPESEIAGRSGDCDVLLPSDQIGHGRGSPCLICREMPKRLSILCIQSRENSAVLTEED